ncbi:hypothetical protein LXL04_009570 [Taraxacum kok-saghyz]
MLQQLRRIRPFSPIIIAPEKKKRESEEKSYDRFEDNNESLNPYNEVELNFGKLTGGLRHKAVVLKYPPYTKLVVKTDVMDSPNKSINESSVIVDEISLDSKASKTTSVSKSNHESESDYYSDKFVVPSSNPRSQFSPPTPFFDDDDDDEENDVMKQTSSSVRLRSELSRRTRGSPSISRPKIHLNPNPKPVTSSSINSRYAYSDEITGEPQSIIGSTTKLRHHIDVAAPPTCLTSPSWQMMSIWNGFNISVQIIYETVGIEAHRFR